jgi:putative aldouronate transport system substrate-binding protein
MLTSGENMDLIYSANWLTYATYAKKGAFMDLTNLIPKSAPKLNTQIPKTSWDTVKVNNKIYAVPNQNPEYVQGTFIYREDLRQKYNLPEIKSIDTIEQYLAGIKKNETKLMPTDEAGCDVYDNLFVFSTPYEAVDIGDKDSSNILIDPKNPHKVLETIETPEYKPFLTKMKSWADQGFWSKSALSKNEDGVTSFENGKSAASFNSTLTKSKGTVEKLQKQHPDWKVGVFEYNRLMNKVHGSAPTQNLSVIPAGCSNPERALALVEKLETDKEYYDLTQYGIKGLSYNLTDDGKLDYSKIEADKHGAPSSWAWTNKNLARQQIGAWDQWETRIKDNQKLATPNMLDAFVLDTDPIQNEFAAVNQVKNQYGKPLQAGLVANVDKAYNTFLSQSKNAGLDKYRDAVSKQLEAYLKEKGIK